MELKVEVLELVNVNKWWLLSRVEERSLERFRKKRHFLIWEIWLMPLKILKVKRRVRRYKFRKAIGHQNSLWDRSQALNWRSSCVSLFSLILENWGLLINILLFMQLSASLLWALFDWHHCIIINVIIGVGIINLLLINLSYTSVFTVTSLRTTAWHRNAWSNLAAFPLILDSLLDKLYNFIVLTLLFIIYLNCLKLLIWN